MDALSCTYGLTCVLMLLCALVPCFAHIHKNVPYWLYVFHTYMLLWIILFVWIIMLCLCICCIVLFISSHILVCYLFTNVDVFQYSLVGLWIVVLHSMFYHDIWYSSLIYFGISLYVIILIRKLYHKVHFDKCKCTM